MLFGKIDKFALECSFQRSGDSNYIFGNICFFVGGNIIGDKDQIVLVDVFASFIRNWIASSRDELCDYKLTSSAEILQMIYAACYQADGGYLDLIEKSKKYMPYILCPGGGESFDGEYMAVIPLGGEARLIWRDFRNGTVREFLLDYREFSEVIYSFINWYDKMNIDKLKR